MKKLIYLFIGLPVCLFASSAQAQVTDIFMRITDATNTTLTAGSSVGQSTNDNGINVDLKDYKEVESLQFDQEQAITIGSTGGSATGKIIFSPLTITKKVDAVSSNLMLAQAKGTLIRQVEILFCTSVSGTTGVSHKIVLKNAAVKTYSASFSTDEDAPSESISFDYGLLQVFTYTQSSTNGPYRLNPYHYGWDRINNASAQ